MVMGITTGIWVMAQVRICDRAFIPATVVRRGDPDVGTVLVPVGGGGLVSGVALACAYHRAGIRVIGVEPAGAAKMSTSLRAGAPVTLPTVGSIADGLLPSPSQGGGAGVGAPPLRAGGTQSQDPSSSRRTDMRRR